ncbi:MAG: hypothetical protein HYU99_03490 [Deltaproteobacteria bacterium]|nr:hypothetical protein [Deltaproteobacteria bacterium]
MDCPKIQDNLLDIIYEEASSAVREKVEAHLTSCRACREEINQLIEIRSVFSKLPDCEPASRLVSNVMALARYTPGTGPAGKARYPLLVTRHSSLVGRFLDAFFVLRPVPLMVAASMILAVTLLFNSRAPLQSPSYSSLPDHDLFVVNEAALRERVLENPFEIENPAFDLKYRDPSGRMQAVSPGFNMEILDDGASLAGIEKILMERRKMLVEADADSLMMRGRRLKAMGRVDMALKDFETIYRFYPDYTYIGDVLIYRAQCHAVLGEYDRALEGLDVYSAKFPEKASFVRSIIEQVEGRKTKEKPPLQ